MKQFKILQVKSKPESGLFGTQVLAVGGIKEKIIAARRAGITCVILPAPNKRDFEELPEYLCEGLEVHYANEYQDVYTIAFNEPIDHGWI